MTRNQIDYLKYLEDVRANKAQEKFRGAELKETHRANVSRENETIRHNVVSEAELERSNKAREKETALHNRTTEGLTSMQLYENQRHNLVSEGLTKLQYQEVQRSNLAREAETVRSNLAREQETHRSNVAHEQETYRSNLARETETHRSNLQSEAIGWANVGNTARSLEIRQAELGEMVRSNMAREAETKRSNIARESLETTRINADTFLRQQSISETERHNQIMEEFQSSQVKQGWVKTVNDALTGISNRLTSPINSMSKAVDAIIPF